MAGRSLQEEGVRSRVIVDTGLLTIITPAPADKRNHLQRVTGPLSLVNLGPRAVMDNDQISQPRQRRVVMDPR
jgi:hypothetical protein